MTRAKMGKTHLQALLVWTMFFSAILTSRAQILNATGVANQSLPPVSLSTNSLPFLDQLVTTTSAPRTIALKNNQSGTLTISGISASGDFAQTSNCPLSPNTLAGGSSCTISITFTPTALGTRTGTLTVSDNASTSPQTANLTGTGSLVGVVSISITPSNPPVFLGHQQQLTATGTFPSNPPINITSFVTWSSTSPESIQVSSSGLVQALAAGAATVTASSGSAVGAITVTAVVPVLSSITVIPANPSQPVGAYQQFSASLLYTDGSTRESTTAVSWSSSSDSVATVNPSGLAAASSTGNTTIQATLGSVSGSTSLAVSHPACVVPPASLVGWWTGDGNTVDIAGNASGILQNGVTYGNGEVGQAFSFDGNGASLHIDSTVYSPTAGTLMFWFFSSGAAGALTGSYAGTQNRAPGFLIDSAGNLNWEFANLHTESLGKVSSNQWNHVALTYSTSNSETVVRVYLNGVLAADAVGDANNSWNPQLQFGAYLGATQASFNGFIDEIAIFNQALNSQQIQRIYAAFSAGMCKPTLRAIAVNPANPSLAPGLSLPFDAVGSYSNATAHDLTTSALWNSSDVAVATINAGGLGTANAQGTTTVSATFGGLQGSTNLGVAAGLVSIQVTPQNPSSPVGTVQSFKAIGTFTGGVQQDLTTSVNWTTSQPAIATITSGGVATCVAAGQAIITATAGSVNASTLLTVTEGTLKSITVSPARSSMVAGAIQQFTATGTFSDNSQRDVTASVSWSSSKPAVATIGSNGMADALTSGQVTITAGQGSVTGTANLTVATATLAAIQLSPQSPSLIAGGTQQFSATGIFSNGSSTDISANVTWNSSASTVATMSNTSNGLAVSTGTGATRVSASLGALTASTILTVEDHLLSLAIAPPTVSLATGDSQQFTAAGTYASGITQDLTNSVSWSSSAPNVAAVSPGGLATSLTSGQTRIDASLSNAQTSADMTAVTPDPLGTANASSIICKGTALPGTCYAVAISCPNTSDLTGYVEVTYPSGTPIGTVLFSNGGNGTYLYETFTYGKMILDTVVSAGYTVADITWGTPYTTEQPHGWQTGPGGIRAVACRYATLAQWIYTNIHLANTAAPFCATGNSGGAEVIGLAMAHYGSGSIFAMVEPTSGPPFARQDWACDCPQSRVNSPCSVYGNYCLGPVIAQNFIDPAYSAPLCSQEILNHTNTYDALFHHDSVVAPDSLFAYPKTFVNFLYGSLDSAVPPNQAHTWAGSITSSKAESCVTNAGHSLPNYLDGAQQIAHDIVNYCKLPGGKHR